MSNLLTTIVLLPLAGFLVNGLAGNRLGPRFVSIVGCGLPIGAFVLAVMGFLDLEAGGWVPRIDEVYSWLVAGDSRFDVAFYLDRLSVVMTLIVTGVGSWRIMAWVSWGRSSTCCMVCAMASREVRSRKNPVTPGSIWSTKPPMREATATGPPPRAHRATSRKIFEKVSCCDGMSTILVRGH